MSGQRVDMTPTAFAPAPPGWRAHFLGDTGADDSSYAVAGWLTLVERPVDQWDTPTGPLDGTEPVQVVAALVDEYGYVEPAVGSVFGSNFWCVVGPGDPELSAEGREIARRRMLDERAERAKRAA